MIKISILEDELHSTQVDERKILSFWLKIRFRSEKERDVVWPRVWALTRFASLYRTPSTMPEIVAVEQGTPLDKKCLCMRIFLWSDSPPDLSLLHPIVNGVAESCKQYLEGILLDAAIKGDLNTKQEGL